MTHEEVEELVSRRVAEEMEAREVARNLETLNENEEEQEGENGRNENGGNGNGGNEENGNHGMNYEENNWCWCCIWHEMGWTYEVDDRGVLSEKRGSEDGD
uniref:Uncharacterized protein n=1 Tax=Tanacetum cinerariifolium TaxID=118510 RepID=A0A699KX81_TANCI|nr:hypothetical protein [Tanacetum cinerariifolium]